MSLARGSDALAAFDRALALDSQDAEAHHERARLLLAHRPKTALEGFRAAHALRPDDPATAANLGAALNTLNRGEEAEPFLSAALNAAPDQPETLSTRGLVRLARGDLDQAISDLQRAHVLAPDHPAIARHLAIGLYECDDLAGARLLLDTVLARHPGDHAARYNLGLIDLAEGNYQAGWSGFESRHALHPRDPLIQTWDGKPRASPLTLTAEQGLGDTLQFLRYASLAAARTPVVLSLPQALRRAAAGLGLTIVEQGRAGVPLGSLPRLFSPSLDHIPPPFAAWHDPRAAAGWARRLADDRPRALRIGLVWSGSAAYRQNRRRSIPRHFLEPLLDLRGVQFISLQRDATLPGAIDAGPALHDLAETAALITALDLVITVDTAVAHLAAGLGKNTWLLDRTGGDWRWLRGRENSPWYPALRIFRQATPNNWSTVIGEVCKALAAGSFPHLPEQAAPDQQPEQECKPPS